MVSRSAASGVAASIREARAGGHECRADEARLISMLRPLVAKAARSVTVTGTVQVEDLEQEAALALLRCCSSYPDSLDFLVYARPLVRRALRDYVLSHSQDVRPSHHAQRGSTQWRPTPCVLGSLSTGDASAAAWLDAVEQSAPVAGPEDGIVSRQDREQLLRAVAFLEDEHRYLVERHYGLSGWEPTSSRELARNLGVSRTSTDGILSRALERLRELMSDADH